MNFGRIDPWSMIPEKRIVNNLAIVCFYKWHICFDIWLSLPSSSSWIFLYSTFEILTNWFKAQIWLMWVVKKMETVSSPMRHSEIRAGQRWEEAQDFCEIEFQLMTLMVKVWPLVSGSSWSTLMNIGLQNELNVSHNDEDYALCI